jgi:hypothetical protein
MITLCVLVTWGVQPRINCAARSEATTANSKAFVLCGR